jgi:hypothetical protein
MGSEIDELISGFNSGKYRGESLPDYDYSTEVNEGNYQDIIKSTDFINELKQFYLERDNVFLNTDQEALDKFYSDRRWRNFNTFGQVKDAFQAHRMNPDQAAMLGRIQRVWEAGPMFFEEGGSGAVGLAKNVGVMALDPLNLIPGASGGKAATKAIQALPAGVSRSKLMSTAAKAGFKAGAITDAGINAGIAFGSDLATQARNKEIGLQDEWSPLQAGVATGAGALMGAGIGGVIGAGGGVLQKQAIEAMAERTGRSISDVAAAMIAPQFKGKPKEVIEEALASGEFQPDPIANPSDPANPTGAPTNQNDVLDTPADQDAAAGAQNETGDQSATTNPVLDEGEQKLAEQVERLNLNAENLSAMVQEAEGAPRHAEIINGRIPDKEVGKLSEDAQELLRIKKSLDFAKEALGWQARRKSLVEQKNRLANSEFGDASQTQETIRQIEKEIQEGDDTFGTLIKRVKEGGNIDRTLSEMAETKAVPDEAAGEAAQEAAPTPEAEAPAAPAPEGEAPTFKYSDGVPSEATAEEIALDYQNNALSDETPAEYLDTLRAEYKARTNEDIPEPELDTELQELPSLDDLFEAPSLASLQDSVKETEGAINRTGSKRSKLRKKIKEGTATNQDKIDEEATTKELKTLRQKKKDIQASIKQMEEAPDLAASKQAVAREEKALNLHEAVSEVNSPFENLSLVVDKLTISDTLEQTILFNATTTKSIIDSLPISQDARNALKIQYDSYLDRMSDRVYYDVLIEMNDDHIEAIDYIRASYGDDLADMIEKNLDGGIQRAKIPQELKQEGVRLEKTKAYKSLPGDIKDRINKHSEAYKRQVNNRLGARTVSEDEMNRRLRQHKEGLIEREILNRAANIRTPDLEAAGAMSPVEKTYKGATGGRMQRDQITGEAYVENPYYGKLFVRDVVFDKDGNPVVKKSKSGKEYKKKYSAGESALRAFDRNAVKAYERTKSGKISTAKVTDRAKQRNNEEALNKIKEQVKAIKESEEYTSLKNKAEADEIELNELYAERTENAATWTDKEAAVFDRKIRAKVAEANSSQTAFDNHVVDRLEPLYALRSQLSTSTKAEAYANEAARRNARADVKSRVIGKKGEIDPEQQALEDENAAIRAEIRGDATKEAVLNAQEQHPQTYNQALQANLDRNGEVIGQASPDEMQVGYNEALEINRAEAADAERNAKLKELAAQLQVAEGPEEDSIIAQIKAVVAGKDATVQAPKEHPTKPADAQYTPKIVVMNGLEIDIRNHFGYQKNPDGSFKLSFLDEEVGTVTPNVGEDNVYMVTNKADGGITGQVFANKDDASLELPRIFWNKVLRAHEEGKIAGTLTKDQNSKIYTIDWPNSKTYGHIKDRVPAEKKVSKPARPPNLVDPKIVNEDLNITAHNLDIPEGNVMAVHIASGKFAGVTRVENQNFKGDRRQTVGEILKKTSGEQYSIGYVPAGTRQAEATEVFKPINPDDESFIERTITPATKKKAGKKKGRLTHDRVTNQLMFNRMGDIEIDQATLPPVLQNTGIKTMQDVYNKIVTKNNTAWDKLENGYQFGQFFVEMDELYKIMRQHAPDGIKLPNETREKSVQQWQAIMANHELDDITVSTGMDMLRRLSLYDNDLPELIDKGDGVLGYVMPTKGGTLDQKPNTILFDPREMLNPDGESVLPQPMVLLHELAHWAYFNLLDPEDHMEFWQGMGKYYGISDQNFQAIKAGRLDDISGELMNMKVDLDAIARKLPGIHKEHEISSPAEFFANNFVMWASSNKKFNNFNLWTKMARGLVGIYDMASEIAGKFGIKLWKRADGHLTEGFDDTAKDKFIDRDFIKLYQKIMPDDYNRYDRYTKLMEDFPGGTGHDGFVSTFINRMASMDYARERLARAMDTDNIIDITEAIQEANKTILVVVKKTNDVKRRKWSLLRSQLQNTQAEAHEFLYANRKELNDKAGIDFLGPRNERELEATRVEYGNTGMTITELALDQAKKLNNDERLAWLYKHAVELDNIMYRTQVRMRQRIKFSFQDIYKDELFEITTSGEFKRMPRLDNKIAKQHRSIAAKQRDREAAELDKVFDVPEEELAINPKVVPETTVADVANTKNPKDMSDEELLRSINNMIGKSKQKNDLLAEFRSRKNTQLPDNIGVPQEFLNKTANGLTTIIRNSVRKGDWNRALQARAAYHFVADTKYAPPVISDSSSIRVIKSENIANAGTSDSGIPKHTPPEHAEALSRLTHRDKTLDREMKTIAGRLISFAAKVDAFKPTEAGLAEVVEKITRLTVDNKGDVLSSKAYTSMREALRTIVKNTKNPDDYLDAASATAEFTFNATTSASELRQLEKIIRKLPAEDVSFGLEQPGKWVAEIYEDWISNESSFYNRKGFENLEDDEIDLLIETVINPLHERVATVLNGSNVQDGIQAFKIFGDLFRTQKHPVLETFSGQKEIPLPMAQKFVGEHISTLHPRVRESIASKMGVKPERLSSAVGYAVQGNQISPIGKKLALNISSDTTSNINQKIDDVIEQAAGSTKSFRKRDVIKEHGKMLKEEYDKLYSAANSHHKLNQAIKRIEASWSAIRKMAPRSITKPSATPSYFRAVRPFDMSKRALYRFSDAQPNSVNYILQRMMSTDMITVDDARALVNDLGEKFDGNQLYEALQSPKYGSNPAKFKDLMNELGYDSVITSEDADEFIHIMNDKYIEPIGEVDYTAEALDDMTLDPLKHKDLPRFGGAALKEFYEAEGMPDLSKTEGVSAAIQRFQVPQSMRAPMNKIARKENLSDADKQSMWSFLANQFRSNSKHLSKIGMHWLSEKIASDYGSDGFYIMKDDLFNKAFRKIGLKLGELPDAATPIKGLANDMRFWKNPDEFTPESHKRIASALRHGDAAIARLGEKEREVADLIKEQLIKEHNELTKLGIPVGKIENYFPQVWNMEYIKANEEQFKAALIKYFKNEYKRNNRKLPQGTPDEIERIVAQKADDVFLKLTHDGSGVVAGDELIEFSASNHFKTRILNFLPEDYRDMEPFLVNDLETVLVRYFDKTSQRRVIAERFGVGMHAAKAYTRVAFGGRKHAVATLMNRVQVDTDARFADADINERVVIENNVVEPLHGREEDITEAIDAVVRVLGDTLDTRRRNASKAEAFLMELQDPKHRSEQYRLRVQAVVSGLVDYGGEPGKITRAEAQFAHNVLNVLDRRPVDGMYPSEAVRKISGNLRAFNSVTLLAYTTLASIPDMAMPLIKSGKFNAWMKAWAVTRRDPEARAAMKNIGVGVQNLIYERMTHLAHDNYGRGQTAFFKATGLHSWTNFQREMSAIVGFEAFKADINFVIQATKSGNVNSRKFRLAQQFLKEYGLLHLTDAGAPSIESVTDAVNSDAVRRAMMKFANDTVFTPNPNDIPIWAQRPIGMIAFQLKSFPLMMARFSGKIIKDAFKPEEGVPRRWAPLAYMMTAGVGMGAGALAARDVIQMRGGDDNSAPELRTRSLSENAPYIKDILENVGIDIRDEGAVDTFLGWYVEGLLAMGGLGLFAEMLHNTADQLDNGAYGKTRIWSYILGPSFGAANQGLDVAAGGLDALRGDDGKNGKERAALRAIASRIPVAGGSAQFRNWFTDLAGEKED